MTIADEKGSADTTTERATGVGDNMCQNAWFRLSKESSLVEHAKRC